MSDKIATIWDNIWVTSIAKGTEFYDFLRVYIDIWNQGWEEKWFRKIPFPNFYETLEDGTTTFPIWNWHHIIFTIEIWKLAIKWIIESDSDTLLADWEIEEPNKKIA